uniref:Uncharacterized protein n=1 Tax=Anopheles albimanus TaxID=7167 RepID=A0A182FYK0_ANOAL
MEAFKALYALPDSLLHPEAAKPRLVRIVEVLEVVAAVLLPMRFV